MIDYIISSNTNFVNKICVNKDASSNTSPHNAVTAEMTHIPTSKVNISCPKVNVKKVNWKKVDSEKYQTLLADRLQRVEKSKDINERVGQITDIVTSTARECAPKMKQKPKNCKTFWCPELAKLPKDSKIAFGDWKKGGCPAEPHCKLVLAKTSPKKKLRNRQRQIHAENRSKMYKEITTAHTENKNLFYKLINRQRQTGREILNELVINGDHLTESDSIRQGWADYFKTLATPEENKNFDEEYKAHIELRKHLIQNVCENDKNETEISTSDVQKVINSMKNSKAADKEGLTAEHFKYGGYSLVQTVTDIVQDIMNGNEIPKIFKEGLITPIYKKQGKLTYNPNSYRRITITSILGKITEKVHLNLVNNMLDEAQSKLQRGFTKILLQLVVRYYLQKQLRSQSTMENHYIQPSLMPVKHSMSYGMTRCW